MSKIGKGNKSDPNVENWEKEKVRSKCFKLESKYEEDVTTAGGVTIL